MPTGGTILLVEDNPLVREAGVMMLEEAGFRVLEAADGEEALRLAVAESGTIDLLLTDLILPGLDGYQLYCRLTAERAGMKVLFMSGYADGEALEPVLREFRSCFMLKPFTYNDLMKAVGEALCAGGPSEPGAVCRGTPPL